MLDLLRARGLLAGAATSGGRVAADFLFQMIERLRPAEDVPMPHDDRPYLVLRTCFVDGFKLNSAASRLRISRRQLTRERSRAIALLLDEINRGLDLDRAGYRKIPIPAILDYLPRPTEARAVRDVLGRHNLVHVHGPPGIGKTCLVADIAADAERTRPVLWHRFRPRINDSLGSLLFELGEFLQAHGSPDLGAQLAQTMPTPDLGMTSRVALKALADVPLLLVLDDYQVVDADDALPEFLAEAASRCPRLRIVTVGRHRPAADEQAGSLSVPPLSRRETESLFAKLGVPVDTAMGQTLHRWTGGVPQLVRLTTSWLRSATPEEVARGTSSLEDLEEVQDFLLDGITELLGTEDRAVLSAASTFRDRFNDDALAYVADRTRGQVQDSSRRLVRYYVAVRSRSGEVAFLHGSVKNYVHSRLSATEHKALHQRAADWYERAGNPSEAAYHRDHARAARPTH